MMTTHRGTVARMAAPLEGLTVPFTELLQKDVLALLEAVRQTERDAAPGPGTRIRVDYRKWQTLVACADLVVQSFTLAVAQAGAPLPAGPGPGRRR